jgi:hypothetical protein
MREAQGCGFSAPSKLPKCSGKKALRLRFGGRLKITRSIDFILELV